MDSKLIGGILLIVGTCIGAGMLGLPIAAAQLGFIGSLILLFICWFVMTASALLVLEVNLWLPTNNNLITMAGATLGPIGQIIAWLSYLLLLYSLLCAYIAGGSDLFHNLLISNHLDVPQWISSVIFTVIFGSVVYLGIRSVDYVNRGLMLVKFSAYLILTFLLVSYVSLDKLLAGDLVQLTSASALTVTITSFGYATIIPSLRVYFAGDVKKLKKAIFIGSTIPLICYILWDAVIMGVIPLTGEQSLYAILHSTNSTSELVNTLNQTVGKTSVSFFVKLFTSICVLTSFLGVALCLTDFFADGLQLEKKGKNNFIIHGLTFIPSLIIAIYFPNIFITALSYAGIYTLILLVLLPVCMAFSGRHRKRMFQGFTVKGGKPLLLVLALVALFIIAKAILT